MFGNPDGFAVYLNDVRALSEAQLQQLVYSQLAALRNSPYLDYGMGLAAWKPPLRPIAEINAQFADFKARLDAALARRAKI